MSDSSGADPGHAPAVEVEARWAAIPEPLLYDPDVSAEAVRVYGVLVRYGTQPGNCYPAHATIGKHVGRAAGSVARWIRELEEAGWVTRVPRWRKGDRSTAHPPDDEEGWEPTSNGYYVHVLRRADQRGVRAEEEGPLRADGRVPSAPESAPKESHQNESHLEREELALVVVGDPSPSAEFAEFWRLYPRRNGRIVGKDTCWRIWRKLRPDQVADVFVCLANYAAACNSGQTFAKDPERWLRPTVWVDWREPPAPSTQQMGKAMQGRAAMGHVAPGAFDIPTTRGLRP